MATTPSANCAFGPTLTLGRDDCTDNERSSKSYLESLVVFAVWWRQCWSMLFLPKFRRIEGPKKGEKNSDEKENISLVCEFNRAQQSTGKGTVSNFTEHKWLQKYRPKVAIHPHRTDYCDTRKCIETDIARRQQILKCFRQSGSSSATQLQQLEDENSTNADILKLHKEYATKAHDFYRETIEKCRADWDQIKLLEASSPESNDLPTKTP